MLSEKDLGQNLNVDVNRYTPGWKMFKKGRIKVIIYMQDKTFETHILKFKDDYTIKINRKAYLVVPEAFVFGEYPTIEYYYNNIMPIMIGFKLPSISALDLTNEESVRAMPTELKTHLADLYLDARALNILMDSKLIQGLYAQKEGLTMKNFLLIGGVILVAVCVYLQTSGAVDILGFIGV